MVTKLECKFFATKTAANYVSNATVSIVRNLISSVTKKAEKNSKVSDYLASLDYNLNINPKPDYDVIEPIEIVLGYKVKKNKRKNQSMYYVPVGKSVKASLRKFSLDIKCAKIVIYLDEITIVNPIGNFK